MSSLGHVPPGEEQATFELPNLNAVRLQMADIFCFWSASLVALIVLTGSWRISVVVATFFAANFFLLFYWYAGVPADPVHFRTFLDGLKVGGHRGLADDAPENTLSAIRLTKDLGADSVEFDLEFTSDGVAVLLHDDDVDRTTDGEGLISQMTYKEVQALNAAAKFESKPKHPYERIPKLEDAIALCVQLKLKIFIDVKTTHPMLSKTILGLFRKHKELYETAAVCSFYPQIVYEIKRADPGIICGHTWRPGFFAFKDIGMKSPRYSGSLVTHISLLMIDELNFWLLHNWMWKFTGANLVLTEQKCISADYVTRWKARGLQVVAWTVNSYHQRLHFLRDLRLPFLTDRLSDLSPGYSHDASDTYSPASSSMLLDNDHNSCGADDCEQ